MALFIVGVNAWNGWDNYTRSPMYCKVHDLRFPATTTFRVEDMTNGVGHKMNTVLVVEDNDDIRRMLRILLESEGFHVLEAASGGGALRNHRK